MSFRPKRIALPQPLLRPDRDQGPDPDLSVRPQPRHAAGQEAGRDRHQFALTFGEEVEVQAQL